MRHANFTPPWPAAGPKPVQPTHRVRASETRLQWNGDYNVPHVNLGANQRQVCREPLRQTSPAPRSALRRHRPDEYRVRQGNLDVPVRKAGGMPRRVVGRPNPLQAPEVHDRFTTRQAKDGDDSVTHAVFIQPTDRGYHTSDSTPRDLPPRPGTTNPESTTLPPLTPPSADDNVGQCVSAHNNTNVFQDRPTERPQQPRSDGTT